MLAREQRAHNDAPGTLWWCQAKYVGASTAFRKGEEAGPSPAEQFAEKVERNSRSPAEAGSGDLKERT